jgi:TonB family protein
VEAKKGPIPEPKLEAPPEVAGRPDLSASARPAVGAELAKPMRPAFVPPPAGHGGKPSPFGPALPAAPDLPTGSANLTVAIVGLNPSTGPPAPLPDGGRDAQFAAGPHLRAVGGAGGTTDSNALVVPGLLVHGAPSTPTNGSPVLVARAAAPTSLRNLTAAVRSSLPGTGATGATADNAPAAGVRVASAPDPILDGRIVYAMTVQMPNVTSYAGSWMIWFAERERVPGGGGPVSAPIPLRKVDPKYVASAISERIEGRVRLAAIIRADGHVDSVQVLHPLDERLDRSAEEAIAKWQFEPARRSGQPVDVDAVIEIPFLLAPQIPH